MTYPNSYLQDLNARCAPADEELRAEEPGKPTVGDLVKPGSIIRTSYDSGPYLVDQVTPHTYYERFRAWSISGFAAQPDGTFERDEHRRGWINELVADHTGPEPVIRKLFICNDATVTVEGSAFAANKRGQGLLF